jgi:DNA methylase
MPRRTLSADSLLSGLTARDQAALIAGARDSTPVRGLTHDHYKYPARFSPAFVRAAVQVFTQPGDLVLDNHVGGGTTLVEALALGRNAIGVDISTLAEFVSSVKTTAFSVKEIEILRQWAKTLSSAIHLQRPSIRLVDYDELGYYKHLRHPDRWRLRKAIEQGLESALTLPSVRLAAFGRCVVLRTSQWALDSRKVLPSLGTFRAFLMQIAVEMIDGAAEFSVAVNSHSKKPIVTVINRSSSGLEHDPKMIGRTPPKLVVTSPPYPGVHVLYHRWQVDGRRESPLPFMIANKLDGAGSSYYTMGDRKYPELKTYFINVQESMRSVAQIADKQTLVLQMVAFSDATWQLPRYLETMESAGLTEAFLPSLRDQGDGRIWRTVPGRRWYSHKRGLTPGSAEVLLIHRKSK